MNKGSNLNFKKIAQEFERSEGQQKGRTDSLNIDAPFEQAIKKILKAKPEPKKSKKP